MRGKHEGGRGRKKPMVLKRVQGKVTAEEAKKAGDMPSAFEVPPPPVQLQDARNAVARAMWVNYGLELWNAGLLPRVSETALLRYCVAWQQWGEAWSKVQQHGAVLPTKKGNIIVSPYQAVMNRQGEIMAKIEAEFGMTPSSRARVGPLTPAGSGGRLPPDERQNPFARYDQRN